jgi:hypothetical protein
MKLSKSEIAKVLAAVEMICVATGTSVRSPSIESRSDGAPVYLESPEGWLISVRIKRLKPSWWRAPELTLALSGYVKTGNGGFHAATKEYVTALPTALSLEALKESVQFAPIVALILPALRAKVLELGPQFAIEAARSLHAAQLNAEFGLDGRRTRVRVGDHCVILNSQRSSTREDRMVLTMDIFDLSAAQVRAIMKVLKAPEPLGA